MSKDSKPRTGIVPAGSHGLATPPAPAGAVVDMQDLMPVIRSFQDHMAAEQTRQRGRIRALMVLFVLALLVALALPFGVVRRILRDQQELMKNQQTAQVTTAQSLEKALREVADSSRSLREELALIRQSTAAQPPPAIVVTADAPKTISAATGTVAVEAVTTAPPAAIVSTAAVPVVTADPSAAVTTAAPPVRAATTNVAAGSVPTGIVTTAQTDLESQLRAIEKAIEERQRRLKSQQGGRTGS